MNIVAEPFLDSIKEISIRAGKEIMRIRTQGFSQANKEDNSPVTEADHASNELITSELRSLFPEIPIVSEEGEQESSANKFFLVDPLDGTKEFLNGFPDFTVNIALIENQRPVLGVVHLPMTGETYSGNKDGARKSLGDQTWSIAVSSREQGPRIVASRSHLDRETEDFIEVSENADVVKAGSSAKFCLIAEGAAEVYPRFGRTMEWDTAAGQAVLEAAGGKVLNSKTYQELVYGKPGYENPGFVAVSDLRILLGRQSN